MKKIGLFYGTTMGTAEGIAKRIAEVLENVEVHNITEGVSKIKNYDTFILGTNTWGYGELQDDWVNAIDKLDNMTFEGKKVAIYSTGDQEGYPNTFVDAIGILYKKIKERGGEVIGFTSKEGYNFLESAAIINDKFAGLAIDDSNQSKLTEERINNWIEQLKREF